jgi:hypothetical protein
MTESWPGESAPVQHAAVTWELWHRGGWWRPWQGRIHYKLLADEHYAFESFTLTIGKRDGFGGDYPLRRAWSREALERKMAEAEAEDFVPKAYAMQSERTKPDGRILVFRGELETRR